MLVEELYDAEAALVDVEVDVAHLEVGRLQGPFRDVRPPLQSRVGIAAAVPP